MHFSEHGNSDFSFLRQNFCKYRFWSAVCERTRKLLQKQKRVKTFDTTLLNFCQNFVNNVECKLPKHFFNLLFLLEHWQDVVRRECQHFLQTAKNRTQRNRHAKGCEV